MKIIEKIQNKIVKIKNKYFEKEYKIAFFSAIILAIIIHFQLYASELTNPDGLWNSVYDMAGAWEASLGRWAIIFVNFVRGGLVSPIIITAINIIVLGSISVIIIDLFKIKRYYLIILTSITIVSIPAIQITLTYYYCADAYILSFLLSVLSVWILENKKGFKGIIFGAIMIMLSMALYQTYLSVTVTLLIMKLLIRLIKGIDSKEILRFMGRSIIMGIIGLILYYCSTQIAINCYNTTVASYDGINEISLESIKNIPQVLVKIYKNTFGFYLKDTNFKNLYWKRDILYILMFLCIIFCIVVLMVRNKSYRKIEKLLGVLILTICFPIAMNFIELIVQQGNIILLGTAALYLPIIYLIVLINEMEETTIGITTRWIGQIIISILLITYIFSDSATYMAMKLNYNQAISTATRVMSRVEMIEDFSYDMPFLFAGVVNNKELSNNSMIYKMANGGASDYGIFWKTYKGSKVTWENFIKNYIGITIKSCAPNTYKRIIQTEEFRKMGIFPASDSIKIIDGIMVIKFSNNPPMP